MALLNYTTEIDADKTANEISKMLRMAGAKAVLTEYEDEYVKALSFKMEIGGNDVGFRLPSDWKPVLEVMLNQKGVPNSYCNQEQAVRTAWRIVKDWIKAQLALVETQMVTTQQVFLPYAVMPNGKTLFENVEDDPKLLLEN